MQPSVEWHFTTRFHHAWGNEQRHVWELMCERVSFHSWLTERDLLTTEFFILAMALLEWGPLGRRTPAFLLPAQTTCYVPDILDSRFPISFFPPNFQAVHQQDDELSILHANGHHLPIRAVGCTPGWVAQVHLV